MNKKALLGLLVAFAMPLTGYLIVKGMSKDAVPMPRHYLPDSVVVREKNGKAYEDTAWHQLADFRLQNQFGKQVSWEGLEDKIVVASFFFTRCPSICPRMTLNMKQLQDNIKSSERVGSREANFIHFLSFSIDPERDSVRDLKRWADRFQINPQNWWLLTGDKRQIYDMAINEMKLGIKDGKAVDTSFFHPDYFVLIDRERNVRGYYHGLDTMEVARLARDIVYLTLEKDPKRPFFLAGKLELIAIVFFVAILGLVLFVTYLRKNKRSYDALPAEK